MWGREQRAATQHFPSHQLRASIAVPRGTGSCCNVEPSAPVWVPAVLRYTNISVPASLGAALLLYQTDLSCALKPRWISAAFSVNKRGTTFFFFSLPSAIFYSK